MSWGIDSLCKSNALQEDFLFDYRYHMWYFLWIEYLVQCSKLLLFYLLLPVEWKKINYKWLKVRLSKSKVTDCAQHFRTLFDQLIFSAISDTDCFWPGSNSDFNAWIIILIIWYSGKLSQKYNLLENWLYWFVYFELRNYKSYFKWCHLP